MRGQAMTHIRRKLPRKPLNDYPATPAQRPTGRPSKLPLVFAAAAVLFAAGLAGYAAVLLNEPEHRRPAQNDEDDNSPAVLNPPQPPGPAPAGMVWVRGGEFYRGDENFPDAQPVRKVYVDGFWMDKTEVTNAQFAEFV